MAERAGSRRAASMFKQDDPEEIVVDLAAALGSSPAEECEGNTMTISEAHSGTCVNCECGHDHDPQRPRPSGPAPDIVEGVKATLCRYLDGFRRGDWEMVMSAYAEDDDITAIGSEAHEYYTGPRAIAKWHEEAFEQYCYVEANAEDLEIFGEGSVAWCRAVCAGSVKVGGEDVGFRGRFTAVMVRRGDEWRIHQTHVSFPAVPADE
ncbi:MAG TPA: nuclear transport factor 2 family protein [Phycisphaerae bacterium]|nr:nuclear transport factor 2 family protein [Phycisphaerae bacterium]HRY66500.1 nuclear transport factor 2 family protein [Phycisphaerae bacterium]HSA28612.1 nuclear transport factor 2 family protein [Phycisphaerae bacterium]